MRVEVSMPIFFGRNVAKNEKANSYAGFCKSSNYTVATKDIVKPTTLNCKDNVDGYAISASISNGYWCVDSRGYNDSVTSPNTGTICIK